MLPAGNAMSEQPAVRRIMISSTALDLPYDPSKHEPIEEIPIEPDIEPV
jgi:hypothetical protein